MDKPNVVDHTFVEDIFDRCDMDNNGALSKDELINMLVRLDSKTWTRQKVEAMLSEMDRDGNGRIDYSEFEKFISSKTRKDKYARNALFATFKIPCSRVNQQRHRDRHTKTVPRKKQLMQLSAQTSV